MVKEVKNNLEKIIDTCRQMHVTSLYLVGSGAREADFTINSDLDFLYTMAINEKGFPAGSYDSLDLMFKLEEITGKKLDLIAEERIRNKYLLKSRLEDKIKVYEA